MFELFTDRVRHVVVGACDTARALGHEFVGAEHLLLRLSTENRAAGAMALQSLGITEEVIRRELLARYPQGESQREDVLPFNAEAKRVLELSIAEVKSAGESRIGTGHMLLALLRTEQRGAVELLEAIGIDAEEVRVEVVRVSAALRAALVSETVGPDEHVRQLLVDAADLAIECDRSTIEVADMAFAIAEDPQAMRRLAELGLDVDRLARLLESHRGTAGTRDRTRPD